jgi:hypothetical protein
MKEFITQGLAYMIDLSNQKTPENITAEGTEYDIGELILHALSLFDIDSPEFNIVMDAIGVEKYCSIIAIKLANKLAAALRADEISIVNDIVTKLANEEIPSNGFKKTIDRLCILSILKYGLLATYRNYVRSALEIIEDSTIQYVSIIPRQD